MPNPWVSLRRGQLIPANKALNEKEQLEKGLEEEGKTGLSFSSLILNELGFTSKSCNVTSAGY
jgi:hypothetical protein